MAPPGPLTLMQGWVDLDIKTFEQDVLKLLDDFVGIHEIIDEMLDERRKYNSQSRYDA